MRRLKLLFLFPFFGLHLLPAQELNFSPKINLFQYSKSESELLYEIPNARVWGWSNNGKIAYSIERQVDGRGGQKIDFALDSAAAI